MENNRLDPSRQSEIVARWKRSWFDIVGFWVSDVAEAVPKFVGADACLFLEVPPAKANLAKEIEELGTQAILLHGVNAHLLAGETPVQRVRVLPAKRERRRNPWASSGIVRNWRERTSGDDKREAA